MGQSNSSRSFLEEEEQSPRPTSARARRLRGSEFLFRGSSASRVAMRSSPYVESLRRDLINTDIPEIDLEESEGGERNRDLADFYPIVSQGNEWMGRSIETLVFGSRSLTPMLRSEDYQISGDIDDESTSDQSWNRRSSTSTLGSLDFLSRGSSLDLGVRRVRLRRNMHGGTLANYYNDANHIGIHRARYRRQSSSVSSASGTNGPNIALSLLAREVTGRQPSRATTTSTRLKQVGGKTLLSHLDNPAAGIVSEVARLKAAVDRGDWVETCNLVTQLTPRLMGDPMRQHHQQTPVRDPTLPSFASPYHAGGGRLGLERDAFVLGGGVPVLIRIFRERAFVGNDMMNDARALSRSLVANKLSSCWNEVLASLRELVYALPSLVENGAVLENGAFIPFLFTLLSHESCFDAAAALIEEILSLQSHSPPPPTPPDEAQIDGEYRCMTFSVPVTTFFLGNVPNLFTLWRGFSARQLAHFCRILALLVFEPEDRQLLESPAVLKSLELLQLRRDRAARAGRDATVDMNQAILLGDKVLMERLLNLLQIMNYAPRLRRSTSYHIMAHFPFISETLVMLGLSEMENWEDVDRLDALAKNLAQETDTNLSELGNVADMLENLSGSLQSNSSEPATQLGHIIHVINAAQQAGVVVGRRGRQHERSNGSSIHVASVPLESPSLDSVASAAMTLTDQAIMRRTNDGIMMSVEVNEGRRSPEPNQYTSSGRLRITAPEDAANELQFNALLLAPYQVEVLFVLCTLLGGRRKIDAQRFLIEHDLIPIMYDMFQRLSFGSHQNRRNADNHDQRHGNNQTREDNNSGSISLGESSADADQTDQPTGIHGPGCDCTPESALSVQYLRLLHNFCDRDCDNYGGRRLLLSKAERQYIFSDRVWEDDKKPEGLQPGLFSKLVAAFSRESDDSPYRFWLASCAESYLRGSSPNEQLFAAKSGLVTHLVKDIVSDRLHCAGSLQTSFDLLGEVCKGNAEVLDLLVSTLDEENFRKLMSTAAANLVDSNVFLRSLMLTVERISASRQFKSTESVKKSFDAWKDHDYGPWTGRSGPETRFYLTHSWWDASLKPNAFEADSLVSPDEEAHDDARSSDWFPPGCSIDGDTALGQVSDERHASPFDASVGYNGWQFSPPTVRLPVENDALAWVLGDAAFLPNTIERLAWFLITNQSRLLRDLLCVVDLRNINHENICCLNTAVVVAIFASKRGQLSMVLRELQRLNDEERLAAVRRHNAALKDSESSVLDENMKQLIISNEDIVSPVRSLRRIPSMLGDRTNVLRNFRELLWFWSEYYTHRGRDRLSLEFSSHIRFQEWFSVVSKLIEDDGSNTSLVQKRLRLPRSPYKRAARIVESPRRLG